MNITLKQFIKDQVISFSESKEFFRDHTVSGSWAREMVDNFVFELDLPFIDSAHSKSFISKADYNRIESQSKLDYPISGALSAVYSLLSQYVNQEGEVA